MRARAAGVTQGEIDEAEDEEDAKGALAELILQRESAAAAKAAEAARIAARRDELAGMRMKDLKARARAAGMTQGEIDDADDEDDAKGVIIKLVLQHEALDPAALLPAEPTAVRPGLCAL